MDAPFISDVQRVLRLHYWQMDLKSSLLRIQWRQPQVIVVLQHAWCLQYNNIFRNCINLVTFTLFPHYFKEFPQCKHHLTNSLWALNLVFLSCPLSFSSESRSKNYNTANTELCLFMPSNIRNAMLLCKQALLWDSFFLMDRSSLCFFVPFCT